MDPHEDDLPLPPLEDGDEAPLSGGDDSIPALPLDEGDAMDDRELGGTAEELVSELQTTHEEGLDGTEDAGDIGEDAAPSDLSGASLIGDDEALGAEGEDFGLSEDELAPDAGDEGFEGEEEFAFGALPDLDADEEGELDDALELPSTSDDSMLWDDRGWEKALRVADIGAVRQLWLEGGDVLALTDQGAVRMTPAGALVARGLRDVLPPERARRRTTIANATAEVSYASGVVGAVRSAIEERTWLLRTTEGGARIVADVSDDAGDEGAEVSAIVVEPTRGCVWVGGSFGLIAYRPRVTSPARGGGK